MDCDLSEIARAAQDVARTRIASLLDSRRMHSLLASSSRCPFPFTITDRIGLPSGCRSRSTICFGAERVGGSIVASMKPLAADDRIR